MKYVCVYLSLLFDVEKRDPDIVIKADNDENLMSFEKSQHVNSKENDSPIIFDFKEENVKVSLNYYFSKLFLTDFYFSILF